MPDHLSEFEVLPVEGGERYDAEAEEDSEDPEPPNVETTLDPASRLREKMILERHGLSIEGGDPRPLMDTRD